MKFIKKLRVLIGILILCSLYSISAFAEYTIDNDGNARSNPYGDSKLPVSYEGIEYYDCYIPYNLTPADIGGYSTGVIDYVYSTYNYSMKSYYPKRINQKFSHWVNGYQPMGSTFHEAIISVDDLNLQVATDKNGNQYYMMAIQKFFYNNKDACYYGWTGCRGQLVDAILTDGTVIHFTIVDTNAEAHTNGGPKEETLWNVQYTFSELKLDQYKNLFHAAYGNMIEISGSSWGSGVSEIMKKYNLSVDGNQIAYYRMYNAKIDDSPKRPSGVGTEPVYNMGNITVSSSGGNNTVENSDGDILVPESWLVGMPDDTKISDSAEPITLTGTDGISASELKNVTTMKEELHSNLTDTIVSYFRISVVFLGMILILYAILLVVSYIFDMVNTFLDISMVQIISLGRLHCCFERDVDENGGINTRRLVKIFIVCLLVGAVLISGGVYFFVNFFYEIATRG